MTHRMSLGDAVQAVQIAKYAPVDPIFNTWKPKHLINKPSMPVMTRDEWLAANP